ncbi:hypothetical protein PVK06_032347 [Gossypium arboreum]|uniref:Uncharacterized protein n=1 Tax=Gossypium arboreum TaxID=29729 RepID=A0ABR0NW89_GOSAR|nr:hypothetical protein PVK06_032347 [Gossypium arboreum]
MRNSYGSRNLDIPKTMGSLPPSSFPDLDICDIHFLGKEVSNDEIKATLFDIAPLKAPLVPRSVSGLKQSLLEHTGFIARRNIIDNILIAQEVIHSMRSIPFMLINVIMIVITSSTMHVLLNGALSQKFKLAKGIC